MSSGNVTAIAELVASYEAWKNGHSKALGIIASVSAILSTMSSSLLILIIARSRDRLSTTYHRLVLGMSISDILYSACPMTFNVMRPIDMSYMFWNARGNQATCSAMGFLIAAGLTASLFYSCSLNMNYLAMVKYNCSEAYIHSRIEKFLHAFPIAIALVFSVVPLAGKNYNGDGASCQFAPVYEPPHCRGIEDGRVREGFDIPCGRGRDGFPIFYWISFILDTFVPPVVVGVSLGMMYKALRNQENRLGRYGAGALNLDAPGAADDDSADRDDGGGGARGGIGRAISSSMTSLRAFLSSRFGRRARENPERPLSSAVMQRAAAYSFTFFLTCSWGIFMSISILALGEEPLALWYLVAIFQPLQGFFNLLIYLQPKVTSARRAGGGDLPWRWAITRALCTSLALEWSSGDVPPAAGGLGGHGGRRRRWAPSTEEERGEVPGPGEESAGSPAEDEKVEIQGPRQRIEG